MQQMHQDPAAPSAQDEVRRNNSYALYTLEQLVYQGEKLLKDNEDKISEADKTKSEDAIKDAKESLASEDTSTEDLDAKRDALNEALQAVGTAIYSQAEAEGEGAADEAGQSTPSSDRSEVVDAEIVDEDEENK